MAHAMMLFVLGLLPGTAESLLFATTEWAPPRHAEALAAHRQLGDMVRALDRRDDSRDGGGTTPGTEEVDRVGNKRSSPRREQAVDAGVLRIRHAGGDPDSRFAEQLRDALVALGVPAARIRLVPAAADADRLILEFSANGETGP